MAHLEALRAGDREALRATVSSRLAAQLDEPGFAARLSVMSHLVPDGPRVTNVAEHGERCSLDLETDAQTARFELVREEGAWKVAGQTWLAKETKAPS